MRITFIRPSMITGISNDALEPLAFGVLSGLTPPGIHRTLYDERIEPIPFDEPTDLVAISSDTFSARRTYQIAGEYHRRNVPVVLGGYHPSLRTDEALGFADAVVVGDAEDTWPAVLEDVRRGRLQRVYRSHYPPLGGMRIERSIFAGRKYGRVRLVQFGRGCCFGCDFCSIHAFYGNRIRIRPVPEVIREIETLDTRYVIFTDDNLFADPDAAGQLLRGLEPLNMRWSCQVSVGIAADEGLLRRMARSGCVSVTIGFESLDPGNLKQMNKAWNHSHGDYGDLVGRFHERGIMVYGTFIFGYDEDTVESFDRSLAFVMRHKLLLANYNLLIPMPGTALYERLQGAGRLLHDPWWLSAEYRFGDCMHRPLKMTADQMRAGCYRVRRATNAGTSILSRGLNTRANTRTVFNAGAYVVANMVNRREMYRKQGMPLGEPGPVVPFMESGRT